MLGSVHAFSQAVHAANTYRPWFQVRARPPYLTTSSAVSYCPGALTTTPLPELATAMASSLRTALATRCETAGLPKLSGVRYYSGIGVSSMVATLPRRVSVNVMV